MNSSNEFQNGKILRLTSCMHPLLGPVIFVGLKFRTFGLKSTPK